MIKWRHRPVRISSEPGVVNPRGKAVIRPIRGLSSDKLRDSFQPRFDHDREGFYRIFGYRMPGGACGGMTPSLTSCHSLRRRRTIRRQRNHHRRLRMRFL